MFVLYFYVLEYPYTPTSIILLTIYAISFKQVSEIDRSKFNAFVLFSRFDHWLKWRFHLTFNILKIFKKNNFSVFACSILNWNKQVKDKVIKTSKDLECDKHLIYSWSWIFERYFNSCFILVKNIYLEILLSHSWLSITPDLHKSIKMSHV